MNCVEKRHVSQRMGSMLHHRFPNGFTDLFMDETDREVSTLTDRAFRSLCVGDDAVYNDELLYGYSPFSCHKPLAEEPLKKTQRKDAKKHHHSQNGKNDAQPRKQQQQKKNMFQVSSFLQALNATEESREGMLINNGAIKDTNGESWDKSALRSIQRELSDFNSDYQAELADGHYRKQHRLPPGDKPPKQTGKDGKSSKNKNAKSAVKVWKLNIKNFFLHSEFSPFQTWRDFKRFSFVQEETVASILSADSSPKWYELPFYKELTEAHRKEAVPADEPQQSPKPTVEPPAPAPPPTAPKPCPPKPPPKPSAAPAEKRCLSEGGEGTPAPWRRNRSRATSTVPLNQPGILSPLQESCSKAADESVLVLKKEFRSVEVKAIEEVSSLASTPFSICQLMTPVIPSRQPTETSEILQSFFSPSALDLPLSPDSEAKLTPEPPLKRDSYKSLASSILFNLKDNRKRVKSRYSPPKFKTSDLLPECSTQTPQPDHHKLTDAGCDDFSGFSTPAILLEGQTVCTPVSEAASTPIVDTDRRPSDDFLLSNLLQNKSRSVGEEDQLPSFVQTRKNRSPMANKQNYPSLNLYKKASTVDADMQHLQIPLSTDGPDQLSPNTLNASKDLSRITAPNTKVLSPCRPDKEELSTNLPVGKIPPTVPEDAKQPIKDRKAKESRVSKDKEGGGPSLSTMDVIRAAREAIHAAKSKALSAAQPEGLSKTTAQTTEGRGRETSQQGQEACSQKTNEAKAEVSKKVKVKKEPPPVPKRTFAKSEVQHALDSQQTGGDTLTNGDVVHVQPDSSPKLNDSVQRQAKLKNMFSARQNNYIKYQRYAMTEEEERDEDEEGEEKLSPRMEKEEELMPQVREKRDSEHIIHDLHALKELERARMGDRMLENAKNKLGRLRLEEEAKAKNDLISRELRNIKKGMMSMRGNTLAKREFFANKVKEQKKPEVLTKPEGNIIVNKALLNDNYDKAKMALEEIISERQKLKTMWAEPQDASPTSESLSEDRVQQHKNTVRDLLTEGWEGKEKEVKERLGDLRDHNHIKHILAQTEPRANKSKQTRQGRDKVSLTECGSEDVESRCVFAEECRENCEREGRNTKRDAPPVPPRSRRDGSRREGGDTKETDSLKDAGEEEEEEEVDVQSEEKRSTSLGTEVDPDPGLARPREMGSNEDNWKRFSQTDGAASPSRPSSPAVSRVQEQKENKWWRDLSTNEATPLNHAEKQEVSKVKRRAPLRPDQLTQPEAVAKNEPAEEPGDVNRVSEDEGESSRKIISPLSLVNGVSVTQSPPDQTSLSSKSSYFSVESALQRNTETESNLYHSMENLMGELEEAEEEVRGGVSGEQRGDSERREMEYYSVSDHEGEQEATKPVMKEEEAAAAYKEGQRDKDRTGHSSAHEVNHQTPTSPASIISPTLGIPALFRVKDNTVIHKLTKSVQPWSLRERGGEEIHQMKEAPELQHSANISAAPEIFTPKEILSTQSSPVLLSENLKKPQFGSFLTVPQEEDNHSGASPLSEGVESFTTCTADTADEMGLSPADLLDLQVSKVPSENSGSNYSGNESQLGLAKPPAVLPKSERAVLKAMKLTTRRMKKEEVQTKSPHKSSQSSSKQRADKNKSDKSECVSSPHKSSSSTKTGEKKNSEKKHRETLDDSHHHRRGDETADDRSVRRRGHSTDNHQRSDNSSQRPGRQSHGRVESKNQEVEAFQSAASERQGRSSGRRVREKPEQRHYSSDRVFSNVPVYKPHLPDKTHLRSQSTDRYVGDKTLRRLSSDASPSEKLDPRNQRIMEELQQRGRARERPNRENPLRRSHSIDAYTAELPHPPGLSRQSSHTSQLSRQSSMEHAIVTQSFPMTQRKILQDPDSGQYFVVDMPVQVKTKTFFDPSTGTYLQLPVQPPEGAVPQASPMEMLSPPLVVYHGFVPVPLSPMARKSTGQASHVEPEEQRHLDRLRQMHFQEGRPYLEPVYGQHEHLLGDFLGTEELDCVS
ncbi:uncharacterized protein LOC143015653 [Genypterus blacodes]|uniref:uncharacterized protein LOC143015653 n=1 Tax=Genypterus blacodes TaxID=154954 RepID=UPI003F7582CA